MQGTPAERVSHSVFFVHLEYLVLSHSTVRLLKLLPCTLVSYPWLQLGKLKISNRLGNKKCPNSASLFCTSVRDLLP
jgi:hypothetical protein